MRALVEKYPLGYEGYLEEEAMDFGDVATDDAAEGQPTDAVVSDAIEKGPRRAREGSSSRGTGVPKL